MTQGSNSKEVLNNRRRPRVVLLPVEDLITEEGATAPNNASVMISTFWDDVSGDRPLLLPLFDSLFVQNPTYGDLFVNLLAHRDWLCLGLYRLRDIVSVSGAAKCNKRVVICSPPRTFPLLRTDLVSVVDERASLTRLSCSRST